MMNLEIKSLLNKMNSYCTGALEGAAGLCVSRTHYEVTVEHYLLKLLEDARSDAQLLLRQVDIDIGNLNRTLEQDLEQMPSGNNGKPVFSPCFWSGYRRPG